jgi:DNA-binding response OmpR family regulator
MIAVNAARILVVDDEFSLRRLMRLYLAKAGFAVAEAGTGAEGLAALRRGRVAARSLGARIETDGQPGSGSEFRLILPSGSLPYHDARNQPRGARAQTAGLPGPGGGSR